MKQLIIISILFLSFYLNPKKIYPHNCLAPKTQDMNSQLQEFKILWELLSKLKENDLYDRNFDRARFERTVDTYENIRKVINEKTLLSLDLYRKIAQLDFAYKDVSQRVEKLRSEKTEPTSQ